MLISAVMPIMSVYRLPQGQYGYSGHVINLSQDVATFAQSLPRLPRELDVIVVRKEGANHTHRDFRVRRAVVLRALQWLLSNNQYYRALGVTIDTNALEQLPHDENMATFTSVTESSLSPDTSTTDHQATSDAAAEDESCDAQLPQSFVPVAVPSRTVFQLINPFLTTTQYYNSNTITLMFSMLHTAHSATGGRVAPACPQCYAFH